MDAATTGTHAGPKPWRPHPGPQEKFLASSSYEALYGGAAGGGKSESLLLGAVRHINNPAYSALYLRREYPELERSVIPRSQLWFPQLGGKYNDSKHIWRFPSGARIYFGHLEHDSDVHQYQSAEFAYIAFDELTTFTEFQYRYMLSRGRSSAGIPVRIRAGTNPGGDGHEWVIKRWAPWLQKGAPEYTGVLGEPGKKLLYVSPVNPGDEERYVEAEEAAELRAAWLAAPPDARVRMPLPLSRVFFPARVEDNPTLLAADPTYGARLNGLDLVERARLRDGDWLIKPARGLYFKRGYFKFIDADAVPAGVRRVRYWDLAGTEVDDEKKNDPDWTVGVKLAVVPKGPIFVEDVVRLRGSPGEVQRTIKATAELDGKAVPIRIGQDPGQAGKFEISSYTQELQGWDVGGYRESGSKITRAGPVSAQAEAGNVSLVRGGWNTPFLKILEDFPEPNVHDDDVDALSGAFAHLTDNAPATFAGVRHVTSHWGRRR